MRDPFEAGRALWWSYPVDRAALDHCAAALAGEHDFTAFTPTQTEHRRFERVIGSAAWLDESDRVLAFEITADAFMRSMIRVLVGTMLEVAGGRRAVEEFVALLDGAPREAAGETAPAHGLYFTGVAFGDGPAFEHPPRRRARTRPSRGCRRAAARAGPVRWRTTRSLVRSPDCRP